MSIVLDAIKENLRKINIVFESTEPGFRTDTKQTGEAKELTVKEFLESFFPSNYNIRKGLIYSQSESSREIDCVILAPNHPPMVTPIREVIIAEGVHAAIEVKPDISTLTENSELYRGLMQIQSVKRLRRKIAYLSTNDLPADNEIPCAIFAAKSRPHHEIVEFLVEIIKKGSILPNELPDIIVTLDNGILFHSSSLHTSIFRNLISLGETSTSGRGFIQFGVEHNTLAVFLLILYSVTPPEPHFSEPILKSYLGFGLYGATLFSY